MLKIIPAEQRHFTDFGWLKTYWMFSFGDYYDPKNIQHGKLRVFNDDIVEPGQGFSRHPHEEMEIISLILSGKMVHKDTMENEITIGADEVQRMSAGTGLYHSEWNHTDEPVHFYQIWISPDRHDLPPSYDQKAFNPESWRNRLALLASDKGGNNVVRMNSAGSIYRAALDGDKTVSYSPGKGHKVFLYVIDGTLSLNGFTLNKGDQGRIADEKILEIAAMKEADFLLIDVPSQ